MKPLSKLLLRILIVDDDKSTRDLIRARLEDVYEILETASPEDALAMALEHKPDAILLDLIMPRVSGFEVCQALSAIEATRQIPVFIVTAMGIKNKPFCLNLGAKGFFEKPIDFKQLRIQLAEILSRTNRRFEERLPMRVALILKGTAKNGVAFEMRTITENVSQSGFLCTCPSPLSIGDAFEVYGRGRGEHLIGIAQVVRSEARDDGELRYGFRLIHKETGVSLSKRHDDKAD